MNRSIFSDDILKRKAIQKQQVRKAKRQKEVEERQTAAKEAILARKRRVRIFSILLVIAAVVLAIFIILNNSLNIFGLLEEKRSAEKTLAELQQTIASKTDELELVDSPEYQEQQARAELGMIREGEILYKQRESGKKPEEASEKEETEVKPQ